MKKVLCLAVVAALVTAASASAATLTLRVVTDAGLDVVTVGEGDTVNFEIRGEITGEANLGLALWGADVAYEAGVSIMAPAGMSSFVKNDGLTNPDGYGGTLIGGMLVQVGGGQNTIANTAGNAPFPIGTVVEGIGATEVVLAEGTYVADADGFVIGLSNAFANIILDGQTGPVYAVAAADITVAGDLTVNIGGGAALTGAASVAYHAASGAFAGGDIELAIDLVGGLIEPRNLGANEIWVKLMFDGNVTAGDFSVSAAAAAHIEQNDATSLKVVFDAALPKGEVPITITGPGVDVVIPYCYVTGDVDCNGTATGLDVAAISGPANWFMDLSTASPRADVDRNGVVNGLDVAVVSGPANWFLPDPAATCTCP